MLGHCSNKYELEQMKRLQTGTTLTLGREIGDDIVTLETDLSAQ